MLLYVNCSNMQASVKPSHHSRNKISISSTTNSSYDHVRTLFIFKCIEQIIDKCNKEFLISLICTNLNPNYKSTVNTTNEANGSNSTFSANSKNTPYSVHNEKLLELIYRHLKSIYGSSFYSNESSNSMLQNYIDNNKPTTYIEAIIMVLLFYTRSYYPPSGFSLIEAFKTSDTAAEPTPSFNSANQVKAQTLDSTSRQKLSIYSTITKSASASSLHSGANVSTSTSSASSKSSNSSTLSHSPDNSSVKFHLNDDDECTQAQAHTTCLNEEKHIEEKAKSVTEQDEKLFVENRNVQIHTLQILSKIIKELTSLCQSNFVANRMGHLTLASCSQAITELLERSKLQKTLLHCFYSNILNPISNSLTHCVLNPHSNKATSQHLNFKKQIQYTYIVELMNTLEHLIELEHLLSDFQTINNIQKGTRNNGMTFKYKMI